MAGFSRKGGQAGHAPNMPKFALCISLPMQCIINLCSKLTNLYRLQSFLGLFIPEKHLPPGLHPRLASPVKKPTLLAASGLDFERLGPLCKNK